ncbi:MAG: hypothetical protein KDC90_00580 [Ignavibacteriae bacterium]|nr:hypothetical protein [Ignavibacteriota bacterium]
MKKSLQYFATLILFSLISISCRDAITTPSDEEIQEEQSTVLSIKPIQNPYERVIWESGKTYRIKWSITDNLNFVKLDLYKKSEKISTIVPSTENDGYYDWEIPTEIISSNHYRLRILLLENDNIFNESVEFEIKGIPTNINPVDE